MTNMQIALLVLALISIAMGAYLTFVLEKGSGAVIMGLGAAIAGLSAALTKPGNKDGSDAG